MSVIYQKATFLLSVADIKQLPKDEGIEIAIVGRSNAGKSSVLNKLTKVKGLARVSKTPGRTQQINIFVLDEDRRLADLPGYGYAKVPLREKERWYQLIQKYFDTRKSLKGLILVMDIRHPLKETDVQLLTYCEHLGLPVHVLLNKADKLSRGAALKVVQKVKSALTQINNSASLQSFSAKNGTGLELLYTLLNAWYEI